MRDRRYALLRSAEREDLLSGAALEIGDKRSGAARRWGMRAVGLQACNLLSLSV